MEAIIGFHQKPFFSWINWDLMQEKKFHVMRSKTVNFPLEHKQFQVDIDFRHFG